MGKQVVGSGRGVEVGVGRQVGQGKTLNGTRPSRWVAGSGMVT